MSDDGGGASLLLVGGVLVLGLLCCGVIGTPVVLIVGLTSVGSSLDSTFDEVSREVAP